MSTPKQTTTIDPPGRDSTRRGLTYRDAGVDIDRATAAKDRIREHARSTFTADVLSDIGSFGGLFRLDINSVSKPVLVASTDGVGTKLKVAAEMGKLDTIGADLVNHCVNDILVQGARPLFFLDYFASAGLPPEIVERVVAGMAVACRENGTALLGGETAEMPGIYAPGDFDLAGTIVGVVEQDSIIDGSRCQAGDRLIALPSSGLHTNGYSLARKALFEVGNLTTDANVDGLELSLGDELLRVHRSYLAPLSAPLEQRVVRGLAHITGGGLTDNLPRILPSGIEAHVDTASWTVPRLFTLIGECGNVSKSEMFRTFNMGVGMVVVVAESSASSLCEELPGAFPIGALAAGNRGVVFR